MYIMGVGYRVGARYKPSLVFRLSTDVSLR